MHRPLWLAALALWLSAGPVFLDGRSPRFFEFGSRLGAGDAAEFGDADGGSDELVIIARSAVDDDGPIDPDADFAPIDLSAQAAEVSELTIPDAIEETSLGVGDTLAQAVLPDPAPKTAAILGHFGTGKPSAFVSRRAGGGGCGGGAGGHFGRGRANGRVRAGPAERLTAGALVTPKGDFVFPLKLTAANADVAGWFASTRMIQTFANPLDRPLEAVYVFPLPTTAAVSDFEMRVGSRRILGVVRPREEAEKIYADAIARGRTASLLTQERVNVFTQTVGNIAPHTEVDVTVTYFHPLAYDRGAFEYVFPMTVGPRYCPDSMHPADAARVSPPSGRSGSEVAVHLVLNAGAEFDELVSPTHVIDVRREGRTRAIVDLARRDEVPNRDFVLRWRVAADSLRAGCVTHRAPDGTGYFSAFLVPPLDGLSPPAGPREVTFLLDASGSMEGAPFDTLRRFVGRALSRLSRSDRFNMIRFGNTTDAFSETAVDATPENLSRAAEWLEALAAGGGTRMLPAVRRFAATPTDGRWQRVVGFVTDGFVGNEEEILAEIRAGRGDGRWFAFGIGASVNRAFVEGVAQEGRGTCEVVLPGETAAAETAADRYLERLASPVLADVRLDPNGLPVADFGAGRLPDVYAGQPVYLIGRYTGPAEGDLVFRGTVGGREVAVELHVVLPDFAPAREALAPMWARERIAEFSADLRGADTARVAQLRERIVATAIAGHLVSDATSIVCVDEDSFVAGECVTVDIAGEVPADTR